MDVLVTTPQGEPILECVVRLGGVSEEDYLRLVPAKVRADFVRGQIIMRSPVSLRHAEVVRFMDRLLGLYVGARDLGIVSDATVRLVPGEVSRMPDIYYFCAARRPEAFAKYPEGAPDFVVEVVVDSSLEEALGEKRQDYEASGVREYWVINDGGRTVHVFRRRGGRFEETRLTSGRLESEAVPGFWIEADWLWMRPPPPREIDCLRQLLGPVI